MISLVNWCRQDNVCPTHQSAFFEIIWVCYHFLYTAKSSIELNRHCSIFNWWYLVIIHSLSCLSSRIVFGLRVRCLSLWNTSFTLREDVVGTLANSFSFGGMYWRLSYVSYIGVLGSRYLKSIPNRLTCFFLSLVGYSSSDTSQHNRTWCCQSW
jgi:hypothetical protein